MSISKWTHNAAKKAGFVIVEDIIDIRLGSGTITRDTVELFEVDEDGNIEMEYTICYLKNSDSSFSYNGTCFPNHIEDAPAYLKDDKALREMIKYLPRI